MSLPFAFLHVFLLENYFISSTQAFTRFYFYSYLSTATFLEISHKPKDKKYSGLMNNMQKPLP